MRLLIGVVAAAAIVAAWFVASVNRQASPGCELPLPGASHDLHSDIVAVRQIADAYAAVAAESPNDPHRARSSQSDLLPKGLRARYYCEAVLVRDVAVAHHLPRRAVAALVRPHDAHLLQMIGVVPDDAHVQAAHVPVSSLTQPTVARP